MTADDVRQDIELKVVELLKAKVAEGTMSEERSQQIAKIILELLKPGMGMDELMRVVPKLDDTATELSPIILPYLRQYENMIQNQAKSQVADLIRTGRYDAAVKLAHNVISQEGVVWSGQAKAT